MHDCNFNAPIKMDDGKILASPGGGTVSNGQNLLANMYSNKVLICLDEHQKLYNKNSTLKELFKKFKKLKIDVKNIHKIKMNFDIIDKKVITKKNIII